MYYSLSKTYLPTTEPELAARGEFFSINVSFKSSHAFLLRLKSGWVVQLGVEDRCILGESTLGEIFEEACCNDEGLMLLLLLLLLSL